MTTTFPGQSTGSHMNCAAQGTSDHPAGGSRRHTCTPCPSPSPPNPLHKSLSVRRRMAAPYLRVALSPCRTVTLSIALGKVASPLRTGTPVGTRNSSLRDTTTRHFQGRNRYPQTPILDSHNFPELRHRRGPRPPPRTPAGLGQPCGGRGKGWSEPEAERERSSRVQPLPSLMILPQILPQLSSLAEPDAPSCIQKELS